MRDIIIAGYARTPVGSFQGDLAEISAPELGGIAIKRAMLEARIDSNEVEELIMGCVLQAGIGQAPARQAGFNSGLSKRVPAVTVNKMCGSGLKTIITASDQIRAGTNSIIVAGGMESMTNAPYLSSTNRGGARLGHSKIYDHMFLDGLEDAYESGRLMGSFAEECAKMFQFTRLQQDRYAIESLENALDAQKNNRFANEITPVSYESKKGGIIEIHEDQQPKKGSAQKISSLKPAFAPDGTITAANASSTAARSPGVVRPGANPPTMIPAGFNAIRPLICPPSDPA